MVKAGLSDIRGGIDLTREDLRSLARRRIERDGRDDRPFGMYCFASDEPEAELARAVERRVFDDSFGNTPETMDTEYAPYEMNSLFTCILDHRRGLPVAACRMIMPGGLGWKSLDDLGRCWSVPGPLALRAANAAVAPERLWDCATLGVEPSYRKGFLSQAIMASACIVADVADASIVISVIDCTAFRVIQRMCGYPFEAFAGLEPRNYLDSPASIPAFTRIPALRERLRRENDPAYDVMFNPSHFEPAIAGLDVEVVRSVIDRKCPVLRHALMVR